MGRFLIVCGSAGRGGVTESMCKAAEARLEELGQEVSVIYPSDLTIGHCTGCDQCVDGRCIIDDDMSLIYDEFSRADVLIMAMPLHFSGPSSLAKTVMDRFQVCWNNKAMEHPRSMALMVCAGSERPNFSHVVSITRAFSITAGMSWSGELCIPDTDRDGGSRVGSEVGAFIDRIIERSDG